MKTEQEQRAWEAHASGLAEKLLRILESHTQLSGLDYAQPPTPLGGGYWASLYGFRLARAPGAMGGELVLRVMPTGDDQCRREAAIQTAVAAAGFPAPQVHLAGGRDAGLGFPFLVMARVPGAPLAAGLLAGAASLWRLPVVLAETIARLHAVDEKPVSEALARAGTRRPGMGAILTELPARVAPLADAAFDAGLAWLLAHRPQPARRRVCHGDFHPFNLIISEGRVSGVVDWTQALLADPAYDVAYTSQLIALWPLEVRGVPRGLGRLIGRLAAWRFRRAYRAQAGSKLEAIAWYEALHAFRLLVRVALTRRGHIVPLLSRDHPWELVAADAARAFQRRTGILIELPPR